MTNELRKTDAEANSPTDTWINDLINAPHRRFRLDEEGRIAEAGTPLARLIRGVDLLHPELTLLVPTAVGAGARLRLHRRLLAWARDLVSELLAVFRPAHPRPARGDSAGDRVAAPGGMSTTAAVLSAAARGVLYQLEQSLGAIPARDADAQLRALTTTDRQALRRLGVRVGRHVVFAPTLTRPASMRARVALVNATLSLGTRLPTPEPSRVSLPVSFDVPAPLYAALGYPAFGGRGIRADVVDNVGARLLDGAPANDVASRLGCAPGEIAAIRRAFAQGRRTAR